MKVIVGLGNPGPEYELTRHNAGFQVMYKLGTMTGAEWKIVKNLQAAVIKGRIGSHDVVLAMPQTYMNLSGQAVVAILQWFKLKSSDVLVIHDDVSLNLGRLKFQQGGGAGGQHGIESIIKQLGGSKEFDRLKFGVGPDPGGALRANYVLGKVPPYDWSLYEDSILAARDAVVSYLDSGILQIMNGVNGKVIGWPKELKEKEERKAAEKLRLDELRKKEKEERDRKKREEQKDNAESKDDDSDSKNDENPGNENADRS